MSLTMIAHNLQQASHEVAGKGWSPVYLFSSEAVITLGGNSVSIRCLGRGLPGMGGFAALELAPQERMTDRSFIDRFPDILKIAFSDQIWAMQCSLPVQAEEMREGEKALARHNLLSLKGPTVYGQFDRLGGMVDFRGRRGRTWQASSSPKLQVPPTKEALLRLATWQMGYEVGIMLYDECMQEPEFTGWFLDIYFLVGIVSSRSEVVVQLHVAGHGKFELAMKYGHKKPLRYDNSGFTNELDTQYRAWLEWMPLPLLERLCLARYEAGNGNGIFYFRNTNHLVRGQLGLTYEDQQMQAAGRCGQAPMRNAVTAPARLNTNRSALPVLASRPNTKRNARTAQASKINIKRNARPAPASKINTKRNARPVPASRPNIKRRARPVAASRPNTKRNARTARASRANTTRNAATRTKRSPGKYVPPTLPQNARYLLPKYGVAFDRVVEMRKADAVKRLLRK